MEGKTSEAIVKCSVEKEFIPKNPVDLKFLRSAFEKFSPASKERRGVRVETKGASVHRLKTEEEEEEADRRTSDFIDHSQPSMAEVLTKFRQLERGRRQTRQKRSSSADRVQGQRSSADFEKLDPSFWDETDGTSSPPPSQTMTLIALFSQMEGKKKGGARRGFGSGTGSRAELELKEKRSSRDLNGIAEGHLTTFKVEEMVEMPEEGLVQTLLTQWKALEKPITKKQKKIWTPPQVNNSRMENEKKKQIKPNTSYTKHPETHQTSVAIQKTTAVSNKTTTTTTTPRKTTGTGSHNAIAKTSFVSNDSSKDSVTNRSRSFSAEVRFDDVTDQHRPKTGRNGRDGRDEQVEDAAPLEGITRNMAEKFRQMETKNVPCHNYNSLPRKKSFKWEVKESHQLGTKSIGDRMELGHLTLDPATSLTQTSPEDTDHADSQRKSEFFSRQHDLVDRSNCQNDGWKQDLPFPSQTKNLLEIYEALQHHSHK